MRLGVDLEGLITGLLVAINRRQHAARLRIGEAQRLQVEEPQVTVAQPHIKIVLGQTEAGQTLDEQGDKLDLGLGAGFAEDIGVKLMKRAQPALLGALVAVELGDAEPLDRPLQRAGLLADHPADRRRHLGPQGDLAAALVGETEELGLYLVA